MAAAIIGIVLSSQSHPGWAQEAPAKTPGKTRHPTGSTPKSPPRITPSKTTTKILGPLDEDGYVDYVAALNEIYGRDVTLGNNAGLLFVRASRIDGFGAAERKRFFELLHCEPLPEQGDYLADLDECTRTRLGRPASKSEEQDRDRAMRGPWSAQDLPLVAQWIEFNDKPLHLIVEGTLRPKCYFPFVLRKGECLFDMLIPAVQASRTAERLLLARAMLNLRNGHIEQAENDLLACHRLGRLIGTTPFAIGALVGLAIDSETCVGDIALMSCDQLSAKGALAYQRELRGLAPLPRVDELMDQCERFAYLQALGIIARPKALNGERSAIFKDLPPMISETTLLDWSEVLEVGNEQFDKAVAILREPSIPRRRAAWGRFHREFLALREEARRSAFDKLPSGNRLSRKTMSGEFGKIMIASFFPAVIPVSENENRLQARWVLDQVGFALTAYWAAHGTYPKDLSELVPHDIAKIPTDPFTEQPLHYECRPDGFTLSSVASNGIDDVSAALPGKDWSDDLVIKVVRSARKP